MTVDQYFSLNQVGKAMVIQPICRGGAFAEEASRAVWPEVLKQAVGSGNGVVVDLGALKFFGSTMLDLIATLNRQLDDGKLAVANVSPTGLEVMQIARFDKLLKICDSVDDAVAAVSS